MALTGKDVSSYQSDTFDATGDSFAIVKATEGTGYVNPHYAGQLAHARALKLVVGHYHFGHAGGVAEAKYFLSHVDLRPGEFLAFDWEFAGETQAERDAFMKYVKSVHPNVRIVLYCDVDFWTHVDTESYCGDGLWIADPNHPAGHPGISHAWLFHQYSETGGIDHNVANFPSKAALQAWASVTPTVAPIGPVRPAGVLSEAGLLAGVSVSFNVKASEAMHVVEIGVAGRDAKGGHHDWAPVAYNVDFAAGQLRAYKTAEQALPAGTYSVIPCYKTADGQWHNLPTRTITV